MARLIATLCLTAALALPVVALPVAARADDAADRTAQAKTLVSKTILKNLESGFNVALEKTVAPMPEPKAEAIRKEVTAEFGKQRETMLEGLSKEYAEKFSLDELKRLNEIYDDKTYLKFQTLNADPSSAVTAISQNSVTKLINMLSIAAASDDAGKAGAPPIPAPAPAPAPAR